jgi:hypothetical protein
MGQNTVNNEMLTSEQQLREIARILAAGVLRLRARVALPSGPTPPGPEIPAKSTPNDLEVVG